MGVIKPECYLVNWLLLNLRSTRVENNHTSKELSDFPFGEKIKVR